MKSVEEHVNEIMIKYIMTEPVSERCKRTQFQACHICERVDCDDNTNEGIVKLKQENKKLKENLSKLERY